MGWRRWASSNLQEIVGRADLLLYQRSHHDRIDLSSLAQAGPAPTDDPGAARRPAHYAAPQHRQQANYRYCHRLSSTRANTNSPTMMGKSWRWTAPWAPTSSGRSSAKPMPQANRIRGHQSELQQFRDTRATAWRHSSMIRSMCWSKAARKTALANAPPAARSPILKGLNHNGQRARWLCRQEFRLWRARRLCSSCKAMPIPAPASA